MYSRMERSLDERGVHHNHVVMATPTLLHVTSQVSSQLGCSLSIQKPCIYGFCSSKPWPATKMHTHPGNIWYVLLIDMSGMKLFMWDPLV